MTIETRWVRAGTRAGRRVRRWIGPPRGRLAFPEREASIRAARRPLSRFRNGRGGAILPMANAIAEPESPAVPPWALALGFHRPVFGPIAVAIAALALFHVVVAL